MEFSPQFLNDLRARSSLAAVIGRRVRLSRKGREHIGLCPFHKEKTPSFTVNEDKGFYHCFGCGAHGSVIDFVMNTEKLSFPEAVEKLAAEAGLEMPGKGKTAQALSAAGRNNMNKANELTAFDENQLTAEGFVRSGVQHLHETIQDYGTRLKATSIEFAKGDSARGLPTEVTHNHVRSAARALSQTAREDPHNPWSIAGRVGEYVGTAIAAIGASHIKTGSEINAWAIWAFGLGSIIAVLLLMIRLSRKRGE